MDDDEDLLLSLQETEVADNSSNAAPSSACEARPSNATAAAPSLSFSQRIVDLNTKYARQHQRQEPAAHRETKAFAALQTTKKLSTLVQETGPAPAAERNEHVETWSGFAIRSRALFSTTLDRLLKSMNIGFVKLVDVSSQVSRLGGDEHSVMYHWATMAVVTSKTETKSSSSGNKYLMLRLSDLDNTETGVFLFGTAYDAHMSLDRGAVILLLAPKIMEAKEGYAARSLSINNDDQLQLVGFSTELTSCPAKKRNSGEVCGAPVSKRKGGYCQYHLKQAYYEMNASRLDVVGGLLNMKQAKAQTQVTSAARRSSSFDTPTRVQYKSSNNTSLLAVSRQGAKQIEGQRALYQEQEDMLLRLAAKKTGNGTAPPSVVRPVAAKPTLPKLSAPDGTASEIRRLEAQMQIHASKMEYEKAAALRDQIQKMKAQRSEVHTLPVNSGTNGSVAKAPDVKADDPAARLLLREQSRNLVHPPPSAPKPNAAHNTKRYVDSEDFQSTLKRTRQPDPADLLLERQAKQPRVTPAIKTAKSNHADALHSNASKGKIPPKQNSASKHPGVASSSASKATPSAITKPTPKPQPKTINGQKQQPAKDMRVNPQVELTKVVTKSTRKDLTDVSSSSSSDSETDAGDESNADAGAKSKTSAEMLPTSVSAIPSFSDLMAKSAALREQVKPTKRTVSLSDCMAGKGPIYSLSSTVTEAMATLTPSSPDPNQGEAPAQSTNGLAAILPGLSSPSPILDSEAILLAARKETSRYETAAQQHAAHQMDQHLERLEKKDVITQEMAKIMEQKCKGFKCKECDRVFEFAQQFCRDMGHTITAIMGIKRFFECKGCHTRIVAYCTLYPAYPCSKCKVGDWQQVSMWKEFKGPELRPKMLPRGEETGFSLRNDPLLMAGSRGDDG